MTGQEPNLVEQVMHFQAQELGLKDKSEEELFAALFERDESWTEEERAGVEAAYSLVRILHADDIYKGQPYVYHLLRVANRLTGYMHISDSEMIIAALLHDSVEDHALAIIELTGPNVEGSTVTPIPEDEFEQQSMALCRLAELFSPRVAALVKCVTNVPNPPNREESYDEWLKRYAQKVEQAASTTEGFLIKFADWCDNGLGIIHSEEPEDSPKLAGFKRKYALALPIFEHRFQDADVQDTLDTQARAYVASQLTLGHERLTA